MDARCEIALMWMSQSLIKGESALVQVRAQCRQPTSHNQSPCWLRYMTPYGVTRPQWVYWIVPINLYNRTSGALNTPINYVYGGRMRYLTNYVITWHLVQGNPCMGSGYDIHKDGCALTGVKQLNRDSGPIPLTFFIRNQNNRLNVVWLLAMIAKHSAHATTVSKMCKTLYNVSISLTIKKCIS